ncbi:MAG TPA: calcium/sodium antiporter [Gemmatimonadetes bacterium]|nr:calcium/sodium antiporter [Gemmatimonadota bacterium]
MSGLLPDLAVLISGIVVLYFGAEWLVRGASRLASSLGVSPIVIGLTVVSLGTSAPELVVCLVAALQGNPGLAIGNVMGSNLANIGLILGLTSLIHPLEVKHRVVWREMPVMLLITFAIYPIAFDRVLSRMDGFMLLLVLLAYLVWVFRSGHPDEIKSSHGPRDSMATSEEAASLLNLKDIGHVALGSAFLVLGGYCIVKGAVEIASALGISEVIIGLTVVAIGTSLPELATSLVAAMRQEVDIAVGNIIGSNIFNLTAIFGTTAIVRPIMIPETVLSRELAGVVLMSLLLLPILRNGWQIKRWEGALLLTAYIGMGWWLI